MWKEMSGAFKRLFKFFLDNILLNAIKIMEGYWLICMSIWA